MKKNEMKIKKAFMENVFAMIAVAISIGMQSSILFELPKDNIKIEILISFIATIIGAFISFVILVLLRRKKQGIVFISYRHKDKKIVEQIVKSLRYKRFNIYYDEDVVKIGDNIRDTILENIKKSDVIIIILSKDNKEDSFLNKELKAAIEQKKKILPVITDYDTEIPIELKDIKYVNFAMGYDENMRKLIKSLETTLEEKKRKEE
jgi:hypothetical protein